jgi:beta-phosphoglucomutase family hydrolase
MTNSPPSTTEPRAIDVGSRTSGDLAMLGLPPQVRACLFDLDGVLTRTATVHEKAWKETFDDFLRSRSQATGEPFIPFTQEDYDRYVDGRMRLDGVRSFLRSRGVELPEGDNNDPPEALTVHAISDRKNRQVLTLLEKGHVEVYEGSVRYVQACRHAGLGTAVVSASANTAAVLESAGIAGLFGARIDGVVAEKRGLRGKPAPDTYLAGAEALGVAPQAAAVFEDALAGVEAGRAGKFALVVGVDRVGQAAELKAHGADIVVRDVAELLGKT